ncbi:MAG: AMP-binding protein, partial [Anaerolineales bacterium]
MPASQTLSGPIVWRPNQDYLENSRLAEFMRAHSIANFDQLMVRSTQDVPWFTEAVLQFLDIRFYKPYSRVVDLSRGIAWPEWCVGGQMNIVHNCLDKYIGTPIEAKTALIWEGEDGNAKTLSYAELFSQVNQAANALRSLGLGKGDAVGLFMPMTPQIVVALLAIAKIGGVILPLFSGYGVEAVASRLADAEAKALFTADGFPRRGKPVEMKSIADKAAKQVPSLKHLIVVKLAGVEVPIDLARDHWWDEFINTQSDQAETEVTNAEDPLMVIYTSGTTG